MDVAGSEPRLPVGLPEDWVQRKEVACPQCGYDLRMRRSPRCPECGEVFRWQALLHVRCPRCGEGLYEVDGDECPRCGLTLLWELTLDHAAAADARLFEYTKRPVRAALGVFTAALNPFTFWSRRPLEAPPVVARLRRLRIAAIVSAVTGVIMICIAGVGLTQWFSEIVLTHGLPRLALVLVLPLVTMLGIPMFTPTLARYRLRSDQVCRLTAYALAGSWWLGLALCIAGLTASLMNFVQPTPVFWRVIGGGGGPLSSWYFDGGVVLGAVFQWQWSPMWATPAVHYFSLSVGALIVALAFVWWWLFLWMGLRRFLRLDRFNAAALFLSTQIIGLLVLGMCLLVNQAIAQALGRLVLG